MKTLELKHLAPYLPYGLECKSNNGNIGKLDSLNTEVNDFTGMKPILRPLSDLTKEIEHNGKRFVPIDKLGWNKNLNYDSFKSDYMIADNGTPSSPIELSYYEWQKFFEWHFDVFNLIEQGLAIDINILKK